MLHKAFFAHSRSGPGQDQAHGVELGKVGFASQECQPGKRDRPLDQGWEVGSSVPSLPLCSVREDQTESNRSYRLLLRYAICKIAEARISDPHKIGQCAVPVVSTDDYPLCVFLFYK